MSMLDEADPILETDKEKEEEEEEDEGEEGVKATSFKSGMLQEIGQQEIRLTEGASARLSSQLVAGLHDGSIIQEDARASLWGRVPSSVDMNISSSELVLEAAAFSRSMIVNRDQKTATAPAEDEERARGWQHILEQVSSIGSIPMSEANSEYTAMQTSSRREAAFTTRIDPVLSFDGILHKEKSTEASFDITRRPSALQKMFAKVTAAGVTTGNDKPSAGTVGTSKATDDNNRKRKLKRILETGSEGPSEPKESATMEKIDPESGPEILQQLSRRAIHNVTTVLDALVKEGALESKNAWRVLMAARGHPGMGPRPY